MTRSSNWTWKKAPTSRIISRRVLRPRVQRPSSRFTVGLENVKLGDTLVVEISHEAHPGLLVASFELQGTEAAAVKSIQFDAQETEGGWQFTWLGANPTRTC